MFSIFWFTMMGASVMILILATSPVGRRLLRSAWGLSSGIVNDLADAASNTNPLSQAKAQVESAVDKGRRASLVVEKAAASIETIKYNLESDQSELHRLENRLHSAMSEGDPNGTAEGYAIRIADLEKTIEASKTSLTEAVDLYERNVQLVRRFQEDVSHARCDIAKLGQQLEQSTAERDLYVATARMTSDLAMDTFVEAKKKVQDQININRGSCVAAKDLNAGREAEMLDDQAERKSRAAAVIERYTVNQ